MTETRFPASGLSAEYGDIVISDVLAEAAVSVTCAGTVILSEKYTPDSNDQITISNIGELAMLYFEPGDMLTATGEDADPVVLTVEIVSATTITKAVTIYPSVIDFSGTLDVTLLKQIPLSRATKKNTAPGRKEYIGFYGGATVVVYAVYKGETVDVAVTENLVVLASAAKIYTVDVSPAVIAALINQPVAKLVYYNVYTSTDSIIRYMVSGRNWQFEKTFSFRNCFGAQETFTCTGDEVDERKWTREFGNFNARKIDYSREMENAIQINTGYITAKDVEVLEDLLNSDDVCVIDEAGLQKVTILEENFSDSSRKDDVKSVSFTYRYAQMNQFKSTYAAFKKPRVFTPEFDTSFE